MFGLSASTVYAVSNGLYIIAVGAAAICTFLIYQSSAVVLENEKAEFEAYKVKAAAEIAQAGAVAASANERAAAAGQAAEEARKEAAQAIREAAQANLVAESERLARASLESRIVARRLTPDQSSHLTAALAAINPPLPVIRVITIGDQEAAAYGEDIVKAIAASGIRIERVEMGLMVPPLSGIFLSADVDSPLSKAFIASRVPVIAPPPASASSDASTIPQLVIGLKPPIQ